MSFLVGAKKGTAQNSSSKVFLFFARVRNPFANVFINNTANISRLVRLFVIISLMVTFV